MFFLGVTHLAPPKIANYITGVPILSKHTLSVVPGGAIHSEVSFTSLSSMSAVTLLFQYYIGEVTRQSSPVIGL
jgi:hypothetical protein